MLIRIPALLDAERLAQARAVLTTATWEDGSGSAGPQARTVKNNQQLAPRASAGEETPLWAGGMTRTNSVVVVVESADVVLAMWVTLRRESRPNQSGLVLACLISGHQRDIKGGS